MIKIASNPDTGITILKNDKLVVLLDASALKESSCIRRLFFNTVIGYRSGINSNIIEFGTAFHLFRSHLREFGKDSFGEAVREAAQYYQNVNCHIEPEKKYLTPAFLQTTCLQYFMKYEKDSLEPIKFPKSRFSEEEMKDFPKEEVALIEPWTKFVLPYYSDDKVDILLAGTMDEIALQSKSSLVVVDCKTSGVWKVKQYLDSYKLDAQLQFYVMIVLMYAEKYPESIFAELVNKYPIGAMIDGVFYKGADQPVTFQRSDIFPFPSGTIREFKLLLEAKVKQLLGAIHSWLNTGTIPMREGMINGSCTTKYGPCKYFVPCSMPDDESMKIILERDFRIEHYNPLNFGGK